MASNPWDEFPVAAPAPQAPTSPQVPGVIYGRPKAPPPQTVEQQRGDALGNELAEISIAEARQKQAEEDERRRTAETGITDSIYQMRNVVEAARKAKQLSQEGLFATGFGASYARDIGGTTAADVKALLNTIGSNTAFDRLQKMREESPTGGALGAVSEIELQLLRDSVASLEQSQSDAQFQSNMDKVIESYQRVIDRLGGGQTELERVTEEQGGEGPTDQGAIGYTPEGLQVTVTDDSPDPTVAAASQKITDQFGAPGAGDLAKQGFTLGLSDEAAGIGGAIAGALQGNFDVSGNYYLNRDVERLRLEEARQRLGGTGTAIEALGGIATGGVGATGGSSINALARAGGLAGGVGGFGYGEGYEGSAGNALLGAAGGAALGAGLGYIGQRAGQASVARQAERAAMGQRAQDISQAGAAEGVTVNRAMVDPRLQNRVSGVDASPVSGGRFQSGMRAIEGQVEDRVSQLGGGQEVSQAQLGDDIQDALTAFRKSERGKARQLYTKAHQLAGGKAIAPNKGLRVLDEQIAELEAAGANSNASALSFLRGVREDLSKGMTVSGLRDQRVNLRGQISEKNLTQTDTERRMNMVLDAVSDDIAQGLSGNQGALKLYREADNIWREQSRFTRQIEQRLVGPRDNPHGAEKTAREVESLMRGDRSRFTRLWRALPEDERTTLAGYIAQNLGKNQRGDFTPATFLRHTSGKTRLVSDDTLRTVFGQEGFQSIQNLRLISDEVDRVTSAMNSRSSKTAPATNYRSWIFNLLLAASPGAYSGNVGVSLGGAALAGGAQAGRDILTTRALLSPKITKWLRQAPNTTNPKAIDAHFERLGDIARAEPALGPDIETIRQAFMQAANDNAALTSSVAQDQDAQER